MSEGPTAADFRDVLDEYWHDRPPASLEDVMALYGVLGWLRRWGLTTTPVNSIHSSTTAGSSRFHST